MAVGQTSGFKLILADAGIHRDRTFRLMQYEREGSTSEELMQGLHRCGTFSNRRRHSLHRAAADVPGGEEPRLLAFDQGSTGTTSANCARSFLIHEPP
jgi:hypothetical protein